MAISPALGEERRIAIPGGRIAYRETGSGPALVFAHGVLVNGDIWRKVVPLLSDGYRCITPDLPLGSHSLPMDPDADLSPAALGQLLLDFVDALELDDVTLVSADTATAFAQFAMARRPDRFSRVVLTAGDALRNFFPPLFRPLVLLGYIPGALFVSGHLARGRAAALGYRPLTRELADPEILESFVGPGRNNASVRRDLAKVLRGIRPRVTMAVANELPRYRGTALLVWTADGVFPLSDAHRLAELLPDASVEVVSNSRSFINEDNPEELARVMRAWLGSRQDQVDDRSERSEATKTAADGVP